MDRTEAKTRQEIIDLRLAKAGWDVNSPAQVTSELDIWVGLPEGIEKPEHEHQGFQYADYVLHSFLCGGDGQRNHQHEACEAERDVRALCDVFDHGREVEVMVQPDVRGEVKEPIEEAEQTQHAAKTDQ